MWHITQELAEATLAVLEARYADEMDWHADKPALYPPGFHAEGWTIAWDGGPEDWTHAAFGGTFDESAYQAARERGVGVNEAVKLASANEFPPPAGVFVESLNNWCLCMYPSDPEQLDLSGIFRPTVKSQ
jgi:hypothetical protein